MAVPPGLTKDGYEVQFGTNHLGHALLIQKLLPLVLAGSDSGLDKRVIILTSDLQRMAPRGGIQFDKLKTTQDTQLMGGPFMRYGQSKLANVLYARELARRYPNITAVSVHPGVVRTGLTNNMGPGMRMLVKIVGNMRATPEQGAYNTLWNCFTNKERIENGAMYEPVGKRTELKDVSVDANGELAGKLWEWTERELTSFMS
jgi:NAD(P)-dependent dehydrogenase (short-subunit alcohol dehydrogenase family)